MICIRSVLFAKNYYQKPNETCSSSFLIAGAPYQPHADLDVTFDEQSVTGSTAELIPAGNPLRRSQRQAPAPTVIDSATVPNASGGPFELIQVAAGKEEVQEDTDDGADKVSLA